MTDTTFAGVDIGKDRLDVAVAIGGSEKFRYFGAPNNASGVELVVDRLKRLKVAQIVIEAIGVFGARFSLRASEAGLKVSIVDPRRIKALRVMEGGKAKTDKLDAQLIARFSRQMSETLRPIPSAEAQELRALSTRRRQLTEATAKEKTRLKQALTEAIAESCRKIIKHLEEERSALEAEIDKRLLATEEGRRRSALLQSIPGVGPQISAVLLIDLPEIGQRDRKKIASLAGVAPHVEQSGSSLHRASISGGRPCVRSALYMAALNASRAEQGFKAEYAALRAEGKPPKVALIAVARKIVVAANSMLKSGTPWTPPETG